MTSRNLIGQAPITHFDEAGLICGYVPPAGRQLLLTVDVEAFDASRIELWCEAMAAWGREAAASGLRFSHFVSMEHVARLRTRNPGAYEEFACSLRSLLSAKCRIYPHNHCVFDPVTGEFPGESSGWPQRIAGYRPRASMFYDVVRRHNLNLASWLEVVTAEYDRLLGHAELAMPLTRAFRPGGWDHGSTDDEMHAYVSALATCGYRVDSSDAAGAFGDRTWRVGTAFGKNVYRLPGEVIELAPSWSLTCGAPLISHQGLVALAGLIPQPRLWMSRRCGVSIVVLHFDHLFHDWHRHDGLFGVRSSAMVADRIRRLMRGLSIVQAGLGLEPATFDDVAIPGGRTSTPVPVTTSSW